MDLAILPLSSLHKYLGEIINNKGNLEDHIKMLEGNVEAAYQTILHIAKDKNFKGLKMAIIWKLLKTCIIPIITYGAESRTTTHKESQKIQTIMNNIIKRILQVPQSTPNDAITISFTNTQKWPQHAALGNYTEHHCQCR